MTAVATLSHALAAPLLSPHVASCVVRWAVLPWELLILGEMGTGKTRLAEHIHELSRRGGGFQYVSLAQLSDELAIAALSGHMKGAWTGAIRDQPGPFELAHDGTVHLDEVGDSPPKGQQVLLRVLDKKEVQRVGDTRWRPVNVRLIASTNQDLDQLVRDGLFRADLLSRFGEFVIRMPPLRDRRDEILPLARGFLEAAAVELGRQPPALSPCAERIFLAAPWPGNIRGLLNVCRYVVAQQMEVVEPEHLPPSLGTSAEAEAAAMVPTLKPLIARIREALVAADGNRTKAAEIVGIRREYLQRVLRAHDGLPSYADPCRPGTR